MCTARSIVAVAGGLMGILVAGTAHAQTATAIAMRDAYGLDGVTPLEAIEGYGGEEVWNVYVVPHDPGYGCYGVVDFPDCEFVMLASPGSSNFINVPFPNHTPPTLAETLATPALNWDSFVTIGLKLEDGGMDPLLPADFVGPDTNPWPPDEEGTIYWAVGAESPQAQPDAFGRVLIMRLAVPPGTSLEGDFTVLLSHLDKGFEPVCITLEPVMPGHCGAPLPNGGDLVPVSEHRSVQVSAFAFDPYGTALDDDDMVESFDPGPFGSAVDAVAWLVGGGGDATAYQFSSIDGSAIAGDGCAHADAGGSLSGGGSSHGESVLEASFEVDRPRVFSLCASLQATSQGDEFPDSTPRSALSLVGPGGTLFDVEVHDDFFGTPDPVELDETGVLEPGVYTLLVVAETDMGCGMPSKCNDDGEAACFSVSFQLEPGCPADTDGNGAVNVDDLTAVILAWGTADPGADVNLDGLVDVDDLILVVLSWGPCV